MWEEVRALAGWAGLIAAVVLAALTERMRKTFATKTELTAAVDSEREDRIAADTHRDARIEDMAQKMFFYMGKLDLMAEQQHKSELDRVKEVSALQTEVRTGFATIMAQLERRG